MSDIRTTIIKAIDEKKGEDIVEIDFSGLDGTICDAFIICSANSYTQVEAISQEIDRLMREEHNEKPIRVEGRENSLWIIVDYGDVMVHIFEKETRDFYALEKLWSDAKIIKH
ncbi:MAG: ribosome silencing factor [Rikenellaceae bacterium]